MAYKQVLLSRAVADFLTKNSNFGFSVTRVAFSSDHGHHEKALSLSHGREKANGREYVGFFINGEPNYADRYDYPYPAIRFKKDDAEILRLRQKEKGDWKLLTLQEKKALYRASFRNTLVEATADHGHWKLITAVFFGALTAAMWVTTFFYAFATFPPSPHTSNEHREKQLQFMIDSYSEPITGFASKWDYEKNRWKA